MARSSKLCNKAAVAECEIGARAFHNLHRISAGTAGLRYRRVVGSAPSRAVAAMPLFVHIGIDLLIVGNPISGHSEGLETIMCEFEIQNMTCGHRRGRCRRQSRRRSGSFRQHRSCCQDREERRRIQPNQYALRKRVIHPASDGFDLAKDPSFDQVFRA